MKKRTKLVWLILGLSITLGTSLVVLVAVGMQGSAKAAPRDIPALAGPDSVLEPLHMLIPDGESIYQDRMVGCVFADVMYFPPDMMITGTIEISPSFTGPTWQAVGVDASGVWPTHGPHDPGEEADRYVDRGVWQTLLRVEDWQEGTYWLRCVIEIGAYEKWGSEPVSVYIDPTPPLPDWSMESGGAVSQTTVISMRVPATDVELVQVGATRVPTSYYKGVRDMDQHDYGRISPTRNLSDVYCAPTSAASCLRYWAENGFPNLVTGTDTLTNYTGLVEGLAGDMGTGERGTLPGRFEDGLRRWISRRGYTRTLRVRDQHPPGQSGADCPTIEDYVRELHTNQEDVLVWLGWYDADGNRQGGHAVTANSFHIRRVPTVTYQVDMMDPWLGQVVTLTWEVVSPPRVLTETARWVEHTPGGPVTRTLTFTRVLHGRVTGFPDDPALAGWVENLFTVSTTDTHAAPGAVVAVPTPLAPSADWVSIGQDADGSDGWSVTWNPQGWEPGLYMVVLTALDGTGREGTTMRMVWVDQPRRIFLPLVLKSG